MKLELIAISSGNENNPIALLLSPESENEKALFEMVDLRELKAVKFFDGRIGFETKYQNKIVKPNDGT